MSPPAHAPSPPPRRRYEAPRVTKNRCVVRVATPSTAGVGCVAGARKSSSAVRSLLTDRDFN